jgi:hypothetical protein
MCLAAVIDGDTDRPLGERVREEALDATATGLLAVTFVVAVLGAQGATLTAAAVGGAAAFALGVSVHLLVLVLGVTVQQRLRGLTPEPEPA